MSTTEKINEIFESKEDLIKILEAVHSVKEDGKIVYQNKN
jgi:hypothetical protein